MTERQTSKHYHHAQDAGRAGLLLTAVLSAAVVSSALLCAYSTAFHADILGFYRIGAVRPHSPYVRPSAATLAQGEAGYDGQMFLTIALDPALAHPESRGALDNPRYRYRRILFPALGYVLSLGRRHAVPLTLVLINAFCFVAIVVVVGNMFRARRMPVWNALFVLGIPGYWCSLLLTTSDLPASLLFALALAAYANKRYRIFALCYGLAALTHETMFAVIGSFAIPLLVRKQLRDAGTVIIGCIPALLWNAVVLWRIPPGGSTSGLVENFAFPGAGIIDKAQAVMAGPANAKWLFDSATFILLCGTFCLLIFSLRSVRGLRFALPCALVYLGFFVLSKMQILSYYIDFLRVYGNVSLLLALSLQCQPWPRTAKTVLLAWCAVSIAFVAAYSMGLV